MTEIIAFFTILKALGFDLAKIIEICFIIFVVLVGIGIIFWVVWKFVGTSVKAFYTKSMTTLDSLPKMEKAISDLNATMEKNFQQTDQRLRIGDEKFMEQAKEINRALRQLTAFAEHIRFLYTKLQLPEPKIGEDDNKQH